MGQNEAHGKIFLGRQQKTKGEREELALPFFIEILPADLPLVFIASESTGEIAKTAKQRCLHDTLWVPQHVPHMPHEHNASAY